MNTIGSYMDAVGMTEEAAQAAGGVWYSEPEIRLAEELKRRGWRFEQQKRISRGETTAVLDFWVEEMLAVEIYGKQFHDAAEDARRDFDLNFEHGIHTLWLPGRYVMRDTEAAGCLVVMRLRALGFSR